MACHWATLNYVQDESMRHRKLGLAALFTTSVPGADFMDVKGHMLSDRSAVRHDPTAISQPVPIA